METGAAARFRLTSLSSEGDHSVGHCVWGLQECDRSSSSSFLPRCYTGIKSSSTPSADWKTNTNKTKKKTGLRVLLVYVCGRERTSDWPVGSLHHGLQVGLVLFQVFLLLYLLELWDHCARPYHLVPSLLSLHMQESHISQTRGRSKHFLISDLKLVSNKLSRILLDLLEVGLVRRLQYVFIKRGFSLLHFLLPLCQQLQLWRDQLTHWHEELEGVTQSNRRSWPLCSKFSSCILPSRSCLVWARLHVAAGKFAKTIEESLVTEHRPVLEILLLHTLIWASSSL